MADVKNKLIRLLINPSSAYGRGLINGVCRYARECGNWTIALPIEGVAVPSAKSDGKANGIIARGADRRLAENRRRSGAPVVIVSDAPARGVVPMVVSDHIAIGRMAARHLLGLGFTSFAFFGFSDYSYSVSRALGFADELTVLGLAAMCYPDRLNRPLDMSRELERMGRWVAKQARPLAVFACNDIRGQHVIEACLLAGLRVPDDVAVLGVDNDSIICQTCRVPLSSIDPGAEQVGYQAAAMLDRTIRGTPNSGRKPPAESVPPVSVVSRGSTEVLVVADELVRQALQIMRRPSAPPTSVDEVLATLPTSRRPFEVRFRSAMGRSPYQELTRIRITEAERLLRETDLSVSQISVRCGYGAGTRLAVAFRRTIGLTPGAYRRRAQGTRAHAR